MQVALRQPEDVAELGLGDERGLRAGADVQPAVIAPPGDAGTGLEVDVLAIAERILFTYRSISS